MQSLKQLNINTNVLCISSYYPQPGLHCLVHISISRTHSNGTFFNSPNFCKWKELAFQNYSEFLAMPCHIEDNYGSKISIILDWLMFLCEYVLFVCIWMLILVILCQLCRQIFWGTVRSKTGAFVEIDEHDCCFVCFRASFHYDFCYKHEQNLGEGYGCLKSSDIQKDANSEGCTLYSSSYPPPKTHFIN